MAGNVENSQTPQPLSPARMLELFTTLPKMRYASKMREEELKNKVAHDFFGRFDCTEIIKNIDFAVRIKKHSLHEEYLLWAEAKAVPSDILAMLTQLVLTIGKARTFNEKLPPKFLGCFDCEKIAFIPYSEIQDVFHQNDFNWEVAPSDRDSKEFKQIREQVDKIINNGEPYKTYCFRFDDENKLKLFILKNFMFDKDDVSKIKIDKNTFINVYHRWLEAVKPTITLHNWDKAKKAGIIDGDFYLADLLSAENKTLKEKLFVVLSKTKYIMNRHENEMGLLTSTEVDFNDNQRAHAQFWAVYERPPREDYWDYIIERRDLLVPPDVRERKGSFFTPKKWVELSQRYIADVFGEDWQDEYYVWDCAAGTGNLLAGLTNKYNIWASTLDKADVDVMHERIENGANLLKDHCFRFDFLNDDFEKLPQSLLDIVKNTPEKLIIYINPPYAEDTTKSNFIKAKFKGGVAKNLIHDKYAQFLRKANHEIFAQFLTRIYFELSGCKIGEFSTQKALIAPNFRDFRKFFFSELKKCFVVPASTFDNVNGKFPIGFKIWDTKGKKHFKSVAADVHDANGNYIAKKTYCDGPDCKYINDWIRRYADKSGNVRSKLYYVGNDFQHHNFVTIENREKGATGHYVKMNITQANLLCVSVYFAVRKAIPANWLNDRDQFLYPNDKWQTDKEFQSDCLAYTLFHSSNNIQSKHGVNHWIPFTESEVNSRDKFASSFMADFIKGKVKFEVEENKLFETKKTERQSPLEFSAEAKAVFDAGRELWKYYHSQPKCDVNASFYDIREHFQGRNAAGRMNSKSEDEKYTELIESLRTEIKVLAKKIEPNVYEYGFLRD